MTPNDLRSLAERADLYAEFNTRLDVAANVTAIVVPSKMSVHARRSLISAAKFGYIDAGRALASFINIVLTAHDVHLPIVRNNYCTCLHFDDVEVVKDIVQARITAVRMEEGLDINARWWSLEEIIKRKYIELPQNRVKDRKKFLVGNLNHKQETWDKLAKVLEWIENDSALRIALRVGD